MRNICFPTVEQYILHWMLPIVTSTCQSVFSFWIVKARTGNLMTSSDTRSGFPSVLTGTWEIPMIYVYMVGIPRDHNHIHTQELIQ